MWISLPFLEVDSMPLKDGYYREPLEPPLRVPGQTKTPAKVPGPLVNKVKRQMPFKVK
jgi:hypothetical protein